MNVTPEEAKAYVKYQLGALMAFTGSLGMKLQHVKPHGALYNMAAVDEKLARAMCEAVYEVDRDIIFMGLAGSWMVKAAEETGLKAASEVFADRAYNDDGTLVSRKFPGAVIKDEELGHPPGGADGKGRDRGDHKRTRDRHPGRLHLRPRGQSKGPGICEKYPGSPGRRGRGGTEPGGAVRSGGDADRRPGKAGRPAERKGRFCCGKDKISWFPGDCTVCVEFGNEISPEINRRIRAFKIALEKEAIDGVVETIPTYRSLSVVYRPEVIRFGELTKKFDAVLETMDSIQIPPPSVIEIPVLYGGDMGPDLEFVAAHNHKTPEEVVRIHTSGEYLIYMLGFIAGFPYLGGMSREIAAPRLKSPRVKIEGGSVGIAGEQTGIYPVASPGGWQLIGRTPLKLYDAEREKPVLLEAGQYIKFRAVDEAEYEAIEKQVEAGTYQYVVFHKEVE